MSTTPTHDELFVLAVDETMGALQGLRSIIAESSSNPVLWPHLAAKLQIFGADLAEHGRGLATTLAAYAEANPEITAPDDGPAVFLLGPGDHAGFWDIANAYANDPSAGETPIQDYGNAVFEKYGRPELEHTEVPIGEHDAVMVLMHLAGNPAAIVQIQVGGITVDRDEDRALLERALAERGISTGKPRFLPPVLAASRFLSVEDSMFDAYGRVVHGDQLPDAQETT
jgi:hypothetical protein